MRLCLELLLTELWPETEDEFSSELYDRIRLAFISFEERNVSDLSSRLDMEFNKSFSLDVGTLNFFL